MTTTKATTGPATTAPPEPGRGSELDGIPVLVRLALRRDRIWWPAWIVPVIGYTAATAGAYEGLYPSEELRQSVIGSMGGNPTLRALYGWPYDLASAGGFTAWRIGAVTCVVIALMSLLSVVRHTREEEETGRLELVRSGVAGRHAALAAAVLLTLTANLLAGLGVALGMVAVGTPAAGSLALGAAFASVGFAFTGVAAVTAQLSESTRTARGLALAGLGVAFLVRSVGDITDGASWLSWLSPIGWANRVQPYANERWWVLALPLALTALLLAGAFALERRRDFAAGVLPPRLGPARAPASLSSPFGLAWRLQRGGLVAWAVGLGLFAVALGSIAQGVVDLFRDNPALEAMLRRLGGDSAIVDAYLAATLPLLATIGSAHSISAALRLRTEEADLRAEPVLATAVPRVGYAASHLGVALLSPVLLMVVAGVGAGVADALASGDTQQVWRVAGAALASIPAVWVLTGVTMALVGLAPRLASLAWVALGGCVLVGQVGQLLRLPAWAVDLSPFSHVPRLPGGAMSWLPLVLLTVVAAGLVTAGMWGYRRRDIV